MVVILSHLKFSRNSILYFTLLLLLCGFQIKTAQAQQDASKVPLLASVEKQNEPGYFIRTSNVVFPEILKGNEEEMLPYIENFSTRRRDYLIRMYTKGRQFLPKAATILKKYNLPSELNILLPLESAYNANAVSKAGAVGYWQIMDEVAREYGMKYIANNGKAEKQKKGKTTVIKGKKQKTVVKLKDDRKNFTVATHSAARYLRDRRRNLDDNWLLVVASYNCGIGNVWNAMKRSGEANPTFWDIKNYLPSETRAYVMNFITLNVIFNNYDSFVKNILSFKPEKIVLPADSVKIMRDLPTDYTDR